MDLASTLEDSEAQAAIREAISDIKKRISDKDTSHVDGAEQDDERKGDDVQTDDDANEPVDDVKTKKQEKSGKTGLFINKSQRSLVVFYAKKKKL